MNADAQIAVCIEWSRLWQELSRRFGDDDTLFYDKLTYSVRMGIAHVAVGYGDGAVYAVITVKDREIGAIVGWADGTTRFLSYL